MIILLKLLVGGYDVVEHLGNSFYVLMVLIVFDIILGVLVAGKERKINSSINLDGLLRKLGLIIAVGFLAVLDIFFQVEGVLIKTGVALLVAYESMSIIEHFMRLGINLKFIEKYFKRSETK